MIYWANNSKLYVPDFILETEDTIYMSETKAKDQMETAETYCRYASEFTEKNGGKPWLYLLVAHDEVDINRNLGIFQKKYENFKRFESTPITTIKSNYTLLVG
ncbi:hypothetical protein [Algoriphagus aquimarinus]|uniref:hypothetical protein n=1 Tax=Algoriphagus aquimarinus TaxID=237018 RepID=UPI0030D80232|tara:strand:+ start:1956 stop:2264 length:309 start_codon:yes stop_codon:yes gene_type:complete